MDLSFEQYRLPNGLEVILREDRRVPVAAVNLWYHVGPANETEGSTGFAHLFEHMMLQGSGHAPGDYFKRLQAVGATGVNGNTDLDRTTYLENVPSNQLELALWLESDRMGFLLEALDQATLSNQQAVARNERRQNIENAPYGLAQEEIYRLLFRKGHPYHSSVLGSHADIQSARLEDLRRFGKRLYVPNNASLAIAGDIDIPATKALVRKYFGTIPRGREVAPVRVPPAALEAEKRKTLTDRVELPRVYLAWHTAGAFSAEDATATVTARMLGGGKASRLFENLVYNRRIAQSASAHQRSLAHGSVFQVTATAKPGRTADDLEGAIEAELKRLAAEGPGDAELKATKAALIAVSVKSLEPLEGVADRLNAYNHYVGHPDFLQKDLRRYEDVTARDVKDFVAERLLSERRAVVHVQPGEKILPPEPPAPAPGPAAPPPGPAAPPQRSEQETWRNRVPPAARAETTRLPVPGSFRLKNGLRVFVLRTGSLPLVTARLVALSGSASDPPNLPGATDFAAAMLNEGAGDRSALDIADDLTALGSTLDTGSSIETSWVSVQALKPHLAGTMTIMRDVVRDPAFHPGEIERLRSDRLVALRQQTDEPMTIAHKVMWQELYGPHHPYGHSALGTEESIANTRAEDLRNAHRRVFGPRNSALILTGDISESEARKLAAETFGGWTGPARRQPPPPPPSPGNDRVLLVGSPGAPQAAVVIAQTAIPRSDLDFTKLSVLNRILGGLFSSRLNSSLRETYGYTYGVSSDLSQNRGPGPLTISTSVDAQFTGPAVRAALLEVSKMKEGGVSPEELKEAKDSVLYSVSDLFDTNNSTAVTIANLLALDLPQDYYLKLASRVRAISGPDVADAADRHLRPGEMKIILVGDRARIETQIRGMDLGDVGIRTPAGFPQ